MISLVHVDVCRWPMLLLLLYSSPRLSTMCLVRFSWCLVLHRRSCISSFEHCVESLSYRDLRKHTRVSVSRAGATFAVPGWLRQCTVKIHIISIVNKSFVLCFFNLFSLLRWKWKIRWTRGEIEKEWNFTASRCLLLREVETFSLIHFLLIQKLTFPPHPLHHPPTLSHYSLISFTSKSKVCLCILTVPRFSGVVVWNCENFKLLIQFPRLIHFLTFSLLGLSRSVVARSFVRLKQDTGRWIKLSSLWSQSFHLSLEILEINLTLPLNYWIHFISSLMSSTPSRWKERMTKH